jgi:phosphotransferase system  glucose/maltose/N-acetylglucosamine-specific IIC component
MEGHAFKFSGIIFLLVIVLVLVGLIFGLMWFFKKPCVLSPEDEMNYKRAVLSWIGAGVLTLLLMFFAAREGVSSAKHAVKAAVASGSLL